MPFGRKEIVYPVMLECVQFCNDSFWVQIMEDLAYAKPPSGTYISKNFLSCSYKGKEFSYKLERKDPQILYNDIYKLLTEKLGILSHKEKIYKKLVFQKLEKDIRQSRQDWASIRKKNIKDVLYEKYVIDMGKKHSLDIKQRKYLLSVILISIMFKTITSKDISYKDDKIQDIAGINFSEGKIILKRDLCSLSENNVEIPESNVGIMSENWEKFLKALRDNLGPGARVQEGETVEIDSI